MFSFIKIIWSIVKSFGRSVLKGIYRQRYYAGVEFFNAKHINISNTAVIEQGSRIFAIEPDAGVNNISISDNCWLGRDVELQAYYSSNITLEDNVSVQDRCKILGDVFIGQNSLLAPDVFLSSGNHYFNFRPALLIKEQDKLVVGDASGFSQNSKTITIGEDCWLGKSVMVKSGIIIGRGSVIAANSFVSKNVPPYEIWGGSPAKFIKKRLEFIPPSTLDASIEDHNPYFYAGFDHVDKVNGFLSANESLCVLNHDAESTSLLLHAEIISKGVLKIWLNTKLIFSKELEPGLINQVINKEPVTNDYDKTDNFYRAFTEELAENALVLFKFFPENKAVLKGFRVHKISNND